MHPARMRVVHSQRRFMRIGQHCPSSSALCFRRALSFRVSAESNEIEAEPTDAAIMQSDLLSPVSLKPTQESDFLSEIAEVATKEIERVEQQSWREWLTPKPVPTSTAGIERGLDKLQYLNPQDSVIHMSPEDFWYSWFLPVKTTQFLMDWASDHTPYWLVVVLVPWLSKMLLSWPLIWRNARNFESRMALIPEALDEFYRINVKYEKADKVQWSVENRKLVAKYGFNPYSVNLYQFVPALVQMPVHMTLYVAIRTMWPRYEGWTEGGPYFCPNLAMADSTWILPGLCGITVFSTSLIFMRKARRAQNSELIPQGKFTLKGFMLTPHVMLATGSVIGAATVPLSLYFSAGFNIYLASNLCSFALQGCVLNSDPARALLGLKPKSYTDHYTKMIREETKKLKGSAVARDDSELVRIQHRRKGRRKGK